MGKIRWAGIFILTAVISSCIFVVDDGDELTSEDSSAAFAYLDSLRITDSIRRSDSLRSADSTRYADSLSHVKKFFSGKEIHTGNVQPQQLIDFARTLIGVPYKYASTDPKQGFDCSGFITYVFNHFDIMVPRSSIDFTEVGQTVDLKEARPGDLVLFTGTDSTEKFVGHMGIIVSADKGQVEFIHSTSGKAYGVTITPMNKYYMGRYMKTIRVFPE